MLAALTLFGCAAIAAPADDGPSGIAGFGSNEPVPGDEVLIVTQNDLILGSVDDNYVVLTGDGRYLEVLEGDDVVVLHPEDAILSKAQGFRCEWRDDCPQGFALRSGGDYKGCYDVWLVGCTGSCAWCEGSNNAGYFCVQDPTAECNVPIIGATATCGRQWDHKCVVASGVGPGHPHPTAPNGCTCAITRTRTDGDCRVTMCHP